MDPVGPSVARLAAPSRAWFRGRLLAAVDTIPANPSEPDGGAPEDPAQPATASAEPPEVDPAADAAAQKARRRRTRILVTAAIVSVLLVVAVAVAALVHLPYYLLSPGDTFRTQSAIVVTGAPTYHDPGSVEFVTVSITTHETSVLEWIWAHFQSGVTIAKASDIVPPHQSQHENQVQSLQEMTDSKTIATVVALEHLGYKVTPSGTGAVVLAVVKGSAAASVLQRGDTIVAVDGKRIQTSDQLTAAIHALAPGARVALEIDPAKTSEPDVVHTVTLGRNPQDRNEAFLGVESATRDLTFPDLPVQVSIKTADVGGPSAGLAFTMGILDVLTKGSISGGHIIATTGTMDFNGCVGPIGGMHQKVLAVKASGAIEFLVPRSEYAEAKRYAGSMKIVAVDDTDDALAALTQLGGGYKVVPKPPGDDGEAAACKPR
jgi:PDZ domain-containing protein